MPNYNPKGRSKSPDRFILLDHYLIDSEAYRSLSCTARALLVEFSRLYNGANNGTLFLSQRTAAERLNLKTHRTAGKYLRELEDRGFIRTRVKGSFGCKTRHATTYILTNKRYLDNPPTRDFRNWKPPKAEKKPRAKIAGHRGKKGPSVPADWPDAVNLSPCNENFPGSDVGNNSPTYNIPGGGPVAGHSEGLQSEAA